MRGQSRRRLRSCWTSRVRVEAAQSNARGRQCYQSKRLSLWITWWQKEGENTSCISNYWQKQSCNETKSDDPKYKSSLEARQRSHKSPVSLQKEAWEKSETRLRVTTKVAIYGENQSWRLSKLWEVKVEEDWGAVDTLSHLHKESEQKTKKLHSSNNILLRYNFFHIKVILMRKLRLTPNQALHVTSNT